MKLKGFMHIVEIIMIFVLVFFVVLQFSYIPRTGSDWPRTKLILQGNDLLFSLDKQDINWFNSTQVRYINKILPGSMGFSLQIKNAIKPRIVVGCICSLENKTTLENILKDFEINGVEINFTVERIPPENITFPLWYDVIFIWGYQNLEENKSYLLDWLENDKGVVELANLSETQIDSVQQEIFGLKWNDSLNPTTDNIIFSSEANISSNEIYTIQKYFYHFPNSTGYFNTFPYPHEFSNFLNAEKIDQIDNESEKILLLQENSNASACIVNYGIVDGRGRVVWVSEGGEGLQEDKNVLIKTLVAWVAGNEYLVAKSELRNSVSLSLYKTLNEDMFQPIEIVLTLGYFY